MVLVIKSSIVASSIRTLIGWNRCCSTQVLYRVVIYGPFTASLARNIVVRFVTQTHSRPRTLASLITYSVHLIISIFISSKSCADKQFAQYGASGVSTSTVLYRSATFVATQRAAIVSKVPLGQGVDEVGYWNGGYVFKGYRVRKEVGYWVMQGTFFKGDRVRKEVG